MSATESIALALFADPAPEKPDPAESRAVRANLVLKLGEDRGFRVFGEWTLDIPETPSAPDLAAYPREPVESRGQWASVSEPPLLTVEISSPTQHLKRG